MATTFFDRTVFKGGHGGVAQRVQYITRMQPDRAEVQVRHQGLIEGTEQQREDLVYWRARNLPTWAKEDPVLFFRAAEQYGSAAWTAYEEWKFSLPRELSRTQQLDAASDFLKGTFSEKHPYVWAMHDPVAADGGRQPHVHVLWSSRTLDGIQRSPEQFFRRYNAAHPERGGAAKARAFSHFGAVKAARVHYTDVMNLHLERAGVATRLHPDRLEARGILREPEPRLSPADSQALKRDGMITDAMQRVLDHRQRYATAKATEQRLALAYWETRRQELGLAPAIDTTHSLSRIHEARVQRCLEAPEHKALAPRRNTVVADLEHRMHSPITLVGNRASAIVHRPGDLRYGAVAPHNQVLFRSLAEAEAAGYRAARNQHYGRGAAERRRAGGRAPGSRALAHAAPERLRTRERVWSRTRTRLAGAWGQDVDLAQGGVHVRLEHGMEVDR